MEDFYIRDFNAVYQLETLMVTPYGGRICGQVRSDKTEPGFIVSVIIHSLVNMLTYYIVVFRCG